MIRLAFIAALAASPAAACDSYVAHMASYHTDRTLIANVNEQNIGLGCRIGQVEIGAYKNSFHDVSAYVVYDSTHEGLGVFAGAASGYHDDLNSGPGGIVPVAGIAYHTEDTTTRFGPSYSAATGNIGMVIGFSVNFGGQ